MSLYHAVWVYDFCHPYFGWLCWEEGDRFYPTEEAAIAAAKASGYRWRVRSVVLVHAPQH